MTRRASTEGGTTLHDFGLTLQNQHMVIYLYMMAPAAGADYVVRVHAPDPHAGRPRLGALREDEIACRSLGLNPTRIKLSAFTLGATFAGFGGAFFAARQGMVNPESFTFIESALILAIVVLGGMGSQVGVILAAVLLTVLPRAGARVRRVPHADVRPGDGVDDDVASAGCCHEASPRGAVQMSEALLKVSGLTMRFGGLLAVDSVAFEVKSDEVFAIIGPNGAGKTTVFNCGRFYAPTAGEILMDGKAITGLPSHKVARHGWCARSRTCACSSS